jgi:DNA-binding HxlR family transcriptional regulator
VKKKITFRSQCPISTALDIFGDKWTLLLIRDLLFNGKKTFGEFLDSEEKIATNILSDRLALLEMAGIISKKNDPDHGRKIIYSLTQKGIDLIPVLVEIIAWSERYHEVHPYAKEFARLLKKDKVGLIKGLFENAANSDPSSRKNKKGDPR